MEGRNRFLKLITGSCGRSVYVDGSTLRNGSQNARSGTGVYFSDQSKYNSSLPVEGSQDSGRAEVAAILHALRAIGLMRFSVITKHYTIHSDSQYAIGVATGVIEKDLDLAMRIRSQASSLERSGVSVDISYIPGHRGHIGNEAAHKLARNAASGKYLEIIP